MSEERILIVNADDFGRSHGINRGVIETHERGVVTSASLMVRWPAAVEAAAYVREQNMLSLGLHLDLGEWVYETRGWRPTYEVVRLNDANAVRDEVFRQLDVFRRLADCDPTHVDSHQHVHRREPVRSELGRVAHQLGVPLRHIGSKVRYCGNFYGQLDTGSPHPQAISAESLIDIVRNLPAGITELGCHPGETEPLESTYREERPLEVVSLCDPRVRAAIDEEAIRLCSFADIQWQSDERNSVAARRGPSEPR